MHVWLHAHAYSNKMDEVAELLTAWGLCELIGTFTDNAMALEALASLTPDDIKELIPKVGLRVLFLRCWRAWFNEYMGKQPTDLETSSLLNIDLSATALEVFNEQEGRSGDVDEEGKIYNLVPVQSQPESAPAQSILRTLLQENLETIGLLAHEGDTLSGDRVRNILAAAIANKILQEFQNTPVRGDVYYKWCMEITKLFPGERTTTYYIPEIFVNKFAEIDTSVEDDLTWLGHASDPWYLVEEKWKHTCEHRTRKLHSKTGPTIEQYVDDFPALKTSCGYCLLELDFRAAHPEHTEKLYLNFPLLKTSSIAKATEEQKSICQGHC